MGEDRLTQMTALCFGSLWLGKKAIMNQGSQKLKTLLGDWSGSVFRSTDVLSKDRESAASTHMVCKSASNSSSRGMDVVF